MLKFPPIVAAQRLQTWLLVMALMAIVVTGLLVVDLARNLRTVVISEANRALTSAVSELVQGSRSWESGYERPVSSIETWDQELKSVSYEVLRSYPDVEGGYLWHEEVVGHSFPTYTEPGSTLRQPALEHRQVLNALEESRRTGRVAA